MESPSAPPTIAGLSAPWRARVDGLVCLLLFLAFSLGSYAYLHAYNILPSVRHGDGDMFGPAIGVALGMGFSEVDPGAPGVDDFYARRTMRLDPVPLQDPLLFTPAVGKFALDRVYLLYAIGVVWRVTGVAWSTVYVLNASLFGCCAAMVYLIFRLVARLAISLAGVLLGLLSPVYFQMLPAVRDFCKAPFIIATILFCGLLLTGRIRGRALPLAAAILGVLIGIGVGFRQDSIICLPMAVACLTVFHRGSLWRWRLAGVAMLMIGFLPVSWPVFRMNAETGGNNAFYITQGFNAQSLDDLDLERATYTPMYTHSDYIVHAYICHYARARDLSYREKAGDLQTAMLLKGALLAQVMPLNMNLLGAAMVPVDSMPIWSYGAEMLARRCAAELITTFPADVLTRAYAAVLRMIRGVNTLNQRGEASDGMMAQWAEWRAPMMRHLQTFGPLYATATFLLIAAHDAWLAFGALALILYFLGYPSIEFQMRHAFHLSFAAFWFPAFLLERLLQLRRPLRHKQTLPERIMDPDFAVRSTLAPLRRALSFLAAVSLLFAIPLWGMRLYQASQVMPLLTDYANATLEPVATRSEPMDFGVLHSPETGVLFRECANENAGLSFLPPFRAPDIEVEYLAADLECAGAGGEVAFKYEGQDRFFEGFTEYHSDPPVPNETIRLFFPAFRVSKQFAESQPDSEFPVFRGISVPEGMRLKQLYRVKRPEDFPFLMTVWLDQDPTAWKDAYTLRMAPP